MEVKEVADFKNGAPERTKETEKTAPLAPGPEARLEGARFGALKRVYHTPTIR
jgi:hypothetical protein